MVASLAPACARIGRRGRGPYENDDPGVAEVVVVSPSGVSQFPAPPGGVAGDQRLAGADAMALTAPPFRGQRGGDPWSLTPRP